MYEYRHRLVILIIIYLIHCKGNYICVLRVGMCVIYTLMYYCFGDILSYTHAHTKLILS